MTGSDISGSSFNGIMKVRSIFLGRKWSLQQRAGLLEYGPTLNGSLVVFSGCLYSLLPTITFPVLIEVDAGAGSPRS
jgi:hypothetical protein